MCGIAGFTGSDPEARRTVAAMIAALAHRGPDGSGIFVDRGIALGHCRLAIIDPHGGAQPRIDPDSGDALIFNGEIYGYRALQDELRAAGIPLRDNSDTEVLFQLIRRWGVAGAIARLDGMFAFAFRDGATGSLYLARDRFGEKPLYYGLSNGELVFGSEVTALRCHPAFRAVAPDRSAAYGFLVFEYVPGAASGWEGIAKLEPGSILIFRDGRIGIEHYWRPRLDPASAGAVDAQTAADRLDELLRDSVRRRLIADVPVGVFLSGGIDSSLVAAIAMQAAPETTAFTVRIGGSGFDETPHAATVARHLGVRHEIVELGERDLLDACDAITARLGEPLADSSLLPTYLVCRAARERMTVALGGDGADELFAGYPNFPVQRFAPAMRRIPTRLGHLIETIAAALPGDGGYMNWRFLLRQLSHGFGAAPDRQSFLWMAPFAPHDLPDLWRTSAVPEGGLDAAFAPIDRFAAEAGDLSPLERLMHLFLVTYLSDDILAKTDRASMFNSLEVRTPFLDRRFAEYACSLPMSLKLRGRTRKYILKQIARRYLPPAIVERKKHGFAVPIGGLIRTLFRERCHDVLLSRRNPVSDWFERGAIERLLDEHQTGRRDHGKKLWALFMLFTVAANRPAAAQIAPTKIPAFA
jgi:asparagine synthase (glutamine-hydrolysing)